ncbi:hypothetical protein VoSk93_51430 [Vibrio owensii]
MFGTDGESSGLVSGCYTLDYVPSRKVIASLGDRFLSEARVAVDGLVCILWLMVRQFYSSN